MIDPKPYQLFVGKSEEVLKGLPDNSVSSIVTDSPYGLGKEPNAVDVLRDWIDHGYHEVKAKGGFMGKKWDSFVPQPVFWKECFRVLKPGGYLLSFFGTRTYDWGVMAIRLAGFSVRDQIQWLYGSGMPKSRLALHGRLYLKAHR
jgi:DNA modification methylase